MLDSLGGGEQLLQSCLSVHSAWNVWERGWHERLAWVQDMELVFRTDQSVCRLSQAELPLTQWHLLFPSFLLFVFWVLELYLTKHQVPLAWPCQHHRFEAKLPRWIRSKGCPSRSLHKRGLDTCVCTDAALSPSRLALVSCFLSVMKKLLLFPDALSVFWLIQIGPVVLPLQSQWLNPSFLYETGLVLQPHCWAITPLHQLILQQHSITTETIQATEVLAFLPTGHRFFICNLSRVVYFYSLQ